MYLGESTSITKYKKSKNSDYSNIQHQMQTNSTKINIEVEDNPCGPGNPNQGKVEHFLSRRRNF